MALLFSNTTTVQCPECNKIYHEQELQKHYDEEHEPLISTVQYEVHTKGNTTDVARTAGADADVNDERTNDKSQKRRETADEFDSVQSNRATSRYAFAREP
eukprot:GILJ01010576.1.p1 GENE.GILJ01010576.1~~GILJ01010576.1.p1  ORF type:complete len:112 (-),score=6.79 GILJ01010576.1:201-503(-)